MKLNAQFIGNWQCEGKFKDRIFKEFSKELNFVRSNNISTILSLSLLPKTYTIRSNIKVCFLRIHFRLCNSFIKTYTQLTLNIRYKKKMDKKTPRIDNLYKTIKLKDFIATFKSCNNANTLWVFLVFMRQNIHSIPVFGKSKISAVINKLLTGYYCRTYTQCLTQF